MAGLYYIGERDHNDENSLSPLIPVTLGFSAMVPRDLIHQL